LTKFFTAACVVLIVAISSNVTEYLTGQDYPTALILLFTGTFTLILNCIVGGYQKQSLFPKQWNYQIVRLLNNGISLFLIFKSYQYLTAGSVSLVQRTDIPFVIIISFLIGEKRSSMQFWLSLWTILMIVFLIIDARMLNEEPFGFILAFTGVTLVSASYIIVKRTVNTETVYSLSNITCLGMMLVGSVIMLIKGYSWYIAPQHIWIFCLGGTMMFLIYVVAVRLYVWYKPERARFPFILGAMLTAVIEMIIERKWYSVSQIALIILISGMIMTISLNSPTPRLVQGVYGKLKSAAIRRFKSTEITP